QALINIGAFFQRTSHMRPSPSQSRNIIFAQPISDQTATPVRKGDRTLSSPEKQRPPIPAEGSCPLFGQISLRSIVRPRPAAANDRRIGRFAFLAGLAPLREHPGRAAGMTAARRPSLTAAHR